MINSWRYLGMSEINCDCGYNYTQTGCPNCNRQSLQDRIEELEAKLKTTDEIGLAFKEDAGQLREKLAQAVKLIELAVELAQWNLNPKLRDDMIEFTTTVKGEQP